MTHTMARGYVSAHNRVRQARGPARKHTCPCGVRAAQWAYDHNDPNPRTETVPSSSSLPGATVVVTWSDDPAHYIAMCYRCHAQLDLERGNRANIGVAYREMRAAIGSFVGDGDVRGEVLAGPGGRPMLRISDARGFSYHELRGPTLPPVEELRRMRDETRRHTEEGRRG